eukprot:gene9798-10642_t
MQHSSNNTIKVVFLLSFLLLLILIQGKGHKKEKIFGKVVYEERNQWTLKDWIETTNITLPITPYALFILTCKIDITIFHWTKFLSEKDFTIFFIEDCKQTDQILSFDTWKYRNTNYGQKKQQQLLLQNMTTTPPPVGHSQGNPNRFIIRIDKRHCLRHQYRHMNYMRGEVTAWDKSIYFLGEITPTYQLMWIFEEDVFIPTIDSFLKVHYDAVNRKSDVIGSKVHTNYPNRTPWLWSEVPTFNKLKIQYPYYHGMACAIGFNYRIIQLFKTFINQVHQLDFLEAIFYTLPVKAKLTIYTAPELNNTVRWNKPWKCDYIMNHTDLWFHPIKNQSNYLKKCIKKYNQHFLPAFMINHFDPLLTEV